MRTLALALTLASLLPAQDLAIARAAARIDTAIPWISDGFQAIDVGHPVAMLPKTDRGALLDQALARAASEKKPVLWYIPRIEGGHMVRPEILDAYMRIVAFTNPRLTNLINARFVPLRMAVDGPIKQRTGIKSLDWVEPAIVILDERGTMLHRLDRIRTFDANYFELVLLSVLGKDATVFRDVRESKAEALYRQALARLADQETSAAEEAFRQVVLQFADDEREWPWAAMAAGNLLRHRDSTPLGPAFHNFENTTEIPVAALTESRPNTSWPRTPADQDDVARRAVEWLLRHQNENGGFEDSRYAWCDSPRILPNVWVAITAIALAGLGDWRHVDPARIEAAIDRGDEYLFDATRVAAGRNEECYADAFRLLYIARELRNQPGPPRKGRMEFLRRRARDISGALIDQQSERGMWAHEYPNAFATAAAMLALQQAEDVGTPVPAAFFSAGASAVQKTQGERGTFSYNGSGRPGREVEASLRGAMGRMPVCERALLCANRDGSREPLAAAIGNFWTHLPRLERIRVCDFHADGELGGFFFWHALFFTSESIKALPPDVRAAHDRKMLEHVLRIGEIDGSFVDSHELGKSYGTGMALMILRNSAGRKP